MWPAVLAAFLLCTPGDGLWFSDIQGLLIDLETEGLLKNDTDDTPSVAISSPLEGSGNSVQEEELLERMKRRVAKFVPVTFAPQQTANLDQDQTKVLQTLVKAAQYIDPIFERQVWLRNPEIRRKLTEGSNSNVLDQLKLEYFEIMRGPWDRMNNNQPFAIDSTKPLGAGFYPEENFDASKFKFYLAAHEDQRPALLSPVTVIKEPNQTFPAVFQAVPFSEEYAEWLEPASEMLEEAANLTVETNLRTFLQSRSKALLSNSYSESDRDWLQVDSRVQIAIGPQEIDEDELFGLKRSLGAFVYIVDQEFRFKALSKYRSGLYNPEDLTFELENFLQELPTLEQNLPIPENLKNKDLPKKNEINIAELVYASGGARKAIQPMAFYLPKDENLKKEFGTRKVLLRNVIDAKYDEIVSKVAEKVMKQKQLNQGMLDADAFFLYLLYKEMSHSLGPVFVGNDETRGEIRKVLGSSYQALEAAKTDVMSVFNLLQKFKTGEWQPQFNNKVLFTYITSLLGNVRFGSNSPQAKAAAVQLNKYLEQGSIVLLPEGRYQVNFRKLEFSLNPLIKEFVTLLHSGRKEDVEEMLNKYSALKPPMEAVLKGLEEVPIDIKPIYESFSS